MKTKTIILFIVLMGIFISISQSSLSQECRFGIFSIPVKTESTDKQIKTFPIAYPQQNENAKITVRTPSAMVLEDIKKTEIQDKNIVLHFTYNGAKKWAQFTKEQTGKQIAFVVNDRIYSTPLVNAEIKTGMAMITGLKDEQEAQKIILYLINQDK
jgi:preprotein translocase subunit SecD